MYQAPSTFYQMHCIVAHNSPIQLAHSYFTEEGKSLRKVQGHTQSAQSGVRDPG